jgi:hypothetical protein
MKMGCASPSALVAFLSAAVSAVLKEIPPKNASSSAPCVSCSDWGMSSACVAGAVGWALAAAPACAAPAGALDDELAAPGGAAAAAAAAAVASEEPEEELPAELDDDAAAAGAAAGVVKEA